MRTREEEKDHLGQSQLVLAWSYLFNKEVGWAVTYGCEKGGIVKVFVAFECEKRPGWYQGKSSEFRIWTWVNWARVHVSQPGWQMSSLSCASLCASSFQLRFPVNIHLSCCPLRVAKASSFSGFLTFCLSLPFPIPLSATFVSSISSGRRDEYRIGHRRRLKTDLQALSTCNSQLQVMTLKLPKQGSRTWPWIVEAGPGCCWGLPILDDWLWNKCDSFFMRWPSLADKWQERSASTSSMSAPLGAFLPFWTQLMNLVGRTRKSSSPSVIGRRTRIDRLLSDFFVLSKRYRLLSQRRMWPTLINLEPAVDEITSQRRVNRARELSPSCVLALWLSVPAFLVSRRDSLFVFLLKFKINVWMKVVASLRSSKRKHVSKRLQSLIFLFEKRIVLWLDHQQFC